MSASAGSPYLRGSYAPIHTEIDADRLEVRGTIPDDLEGIFVRTGANPRFAAKGRHHWFDGDGMLHAVAFRDGRATYRNRWVRTRAFLAEAEAGAALFTGLNEPPDFSNPHGAFKDTSNTDVVYHAGELLSLWWMTGDAYVVALPTLETLGTRRDRVRMAAHPKVDPRTGEMVFMTHGPTPPFLTVGVVSPEGEVVHRAPIELPGPRLQHDLAITERYTLVFDLTMRWDPALLAQGRVRVVFPRDVPTRIGVMPRRGRGAEVRWFEAEPCYMYHAINAFEDGDEVVLIGCRIADPLVGDPGMAPDVRPAPSIGYLRLEPYLHEWRLDLRTGALRERRLDDALGEFPRIDDRSLGVRSRYVYDPHIADTAELRFDGVMKYDLANGRRHLHAYPAGVFGGEVCFAPRRGAEGEDDGYLLTFLADEATGASELLVLDARDVEGEPVARVRIPARVPTGFHAQWVTADELAAQRPRT